MKKLLITLLTLLLTLCALVGLTACEEPEPQAPEIDYSKYNYYGNYSFRSNLSNGGTLELNFKLGKDNKYEMTLDVYSVNGLCLVDVTEEGSYSMSTLDEPIFDETMNVIYMLSLTPYLSTGFANYESVYGFYGYITQGFYMDYWWYYIDHYQYGASVYFGKDGNQYKAEYSKLKYEVTYIASAGGKINGYTNQSIIEGEDTVEVTAVPDYGYAFNRWSDGVTSATRKETNVYSKIEVTAHFVEALPKYTLTYTSTDGGTLQGELSQTLFQGLNGTKVTAIPNKSSITGGYPYQFIEWSDGVKTAERTDLNVQGNISVKAIFKPQYEYYAENCAGGRIEISTNIANHANNYTVTATAIADKGWVFVEWKDGVKTETRTDVLTHDTTIQAVFAREINVIATTGGKIYESDNEETEMKLSITPPTNSETIYYIQAIADEGYKFVGWSASEDGSYIINVNGTVMINFYFEYNTCYAIFAEDGEQGGGSGSNDDGEQGGGSGSNEEENEEELDFFNFILYDDREISIISVQENSVVKLDSITKEGYTFNGWRINGQLKQAGEIITITSNTTAYASWAIDTYSIIYNLGEGVLENKKTNFTIQDLPYSLPNPMPQGELCFVKWTTDETGQNSIEKITELKNYEVYAHYENSAEFLTYRYNEGLQGYEVSGYTGNGKDLSIPSLYRGVAVKSIGASAFYNCDSLTSIEIPNSVTSIGDMAFYNCSSLASIEIPNSVTSIGYYVFSNCSSLTSIEIPNSVTGIGGYAFSYCENLTSVIFEEDSKLNEIDYSAFENCSSLSSIEIPDSVRSINGRAFYNCDSLTSIEIPAGITYIGDDVFGDSNELKTMIINSSYVANVSFIGELLQNAIDVYIHTDITVTANIYNIIFNNLGVEEIDGVEYYHYQIKE